MQNNLAQEIKQANLGILIGNMSLRVLLYADNIVLVAETEINLQQNVLSFIGAECINTEQR